MGPFFIQEKTLKTIIALTLMVLSVSALSAEVIKLKNGSEVEVEGKYGPIQIFCESASAVKCTIVSVMSGYSTFYEVHMDGVKANVFSDFDTAATVIESLKKKGLCK